MNSRIPPVRPLRDPSRFFRLSGLFGLSGLSGLSGLFGLFGLFGLSGLLGLFFLPACPGPDGPASRPAPRAKAEAHRPPPPRLAPDSSAKGRHPSWDHAKIGNRARLGELTPRQRALLESQGFFLAEQPASPSGRKNRARHLFHVYERNDYIAFPSFVTVDLAIDATHAYFSAVLREVEKDHVIPRLAEGLRLLMVEAGAVHRRARTAEARKEALRALAFWGVALRLLDTPAKGDAPDVAPVRSAGADEDEAPPAPRPGVRPVRGKGSRAAKPSTDPRFPVPVAARALVGEAVKALQEARGPLPKGLLRAPLDLTQLRPRGHYNGTGVMQRYFRAMSWLGMASFPVVGQEADVPLVTLLGRSWLGSPQGAKSLGQARELTAFFAGGPDAAGLDAVARSLGSLLPGAAKAAPDALLARPLQEKLAAALALLPPPRIQSTATGSSAPIQVRVMGRRAFEDNVALGRLIGPLESIVTGGKDPGVAVRGTAAMASAALLGSDLAMEIIVQPTPALRHEALARAISLGRGDLGKLPASRWGEDAYHGTLHALTALLPAAASGRPVLLGTRGWRLRALGAFAGGWAELRHDTILYGEQSGAECDAPDPPPPPGWVEPVPELYERLALMVRELEKRLASAGVPVQKAKEGVYARPLAEKTKTLLGILEFLRDVSRRELAGKGLTAAELRRITLIGGEVEWLLISLANTDLLAERDQDMAVVADVFTWRTAGQAVEVGVGHPDLIYAIIPGPQGPFLARGAVMSYREFLQPVSQRLTDEEWRARLGAGKAPPRPAWLEPIYAEPVPAIKVVGQGVSRCGPSSGVGLEL